MSTSNLRLVSLNNLRQRLQAILAAEPRLLERFDRALRDRDDGVIASAMNELRHYPPGIRRAVESAVLDWLFDAPDASGLEHLSVSGKAVH